MNTYLTQIGKQLEDIQKLLKVTKEEFSNMTGISLLEIKRIERSPETMRKSTAMQIFMIANARAKFEQERSVRALLALCFQLDEMDTLKFMNKLNSSKIA